MVVCSRALTVHRVDVVCAVRAAGKQARGGRGGGLLHRLGSQLSARWSISISLETYHFLCACWQKTWCFCFGIPIGM